MRDEVVDAKDAEAEEKGDKAVDDEAEAEEKGDKAVDDEAEKMIAEAEDRVAKAWVPSDIKLEIVNGEKEGSGWLIVDDTHICYQNNVKGKKGENRRWKVDSIRWECSKRRHMGCPFQIFTSLPENGAPIKALSMKKPQVHTCSAEKLTPLMHKFRLKLASRMQDDLDLSWTKIWNKERQLLLPSWPMMDGAFTFSPPLRHRRIPFPDSFSGKEEKGCRNITGRQVEANTPGKRSQVG